MKANTQAKTAPSSEDAVGVKAPVLNSLEVLRGWVREDLVGSSPSGLKAWLIVPGLWWCFKWLAVQAFMAVFSFDRTYHKLKSEPSLLEGGEPPKLRLGLMHPMFSHCYQVTFSRDDHHSSMVSRAVALVDAAMQFFSEIESKGLSVDKGRGGNLDMAQYGNLFRRAVRPGLGTNLLFDHPSSKHIAVMVGGRPYFMWALDNDGRYLGPDKIHSQLEAIVEQAKQLPAANLGVLTGLSRKVWARRRKALARRDHNQVALEAIDGALFVLALDTGCRPGEGKEGLDRIQTIAHNMYAVNFANRWYDKSMQIVVSENAEAAVIFNFVSYLDGQIGNRMATVLWEGSTRFRHQPRNTDNATPSVIPFRVAGNEIAAATAQVTPYIRDTPDMFNIDIGKSFFKQRGVSPDSGVMLAMLLAMRKEFGKNLVMRQFVSMRQFRGGTLELPYINTRSGDRFIVEAAGQQMEKHKLAELLAKAIGEHKAILARTLKGRSPKTLFNFSLADASRVRILLSRYLISPFFRLLGFRKYTSDMLGTSIHSADVFTSSLKLGPGIDMVGRPGLNWPCLQYFGLHYLIEEERIFIVFMPSKQREAEWRRENWSVMPRLAERFRESLLQLGDILDAREA